MTNARQCKLDTGTGGKTIENKGEYRCVLSSFSLRCACVQGTVHLKTNKPKTKNKKKHTWLCAYIVIRINCMLYFYKIFFFFWFCVSFLPCLLILNVPVSTPHLSFPLASHLPPSRTHSHCIRSNAFQERHYAKPIDITPTSTPPSHIPY